MRPADQRAGEIGTVQRASRRGVGAHQRALGALEDTIGSRRIAAGAEPAHPIRKVAALTGGLAHDVSILLGIGRHFGSQPRANTSITIKRAPQRGHGQASTRGVSAVISGGTCGYALDISLRVAFFGVAQLNSSTEQAAALA